ncbi:MAG: TauD/TfdA family dioxygenase [Alphaproteobacteria bacterium]|nr:TauD/TfdA family dioxygenase [Alphaproteobacteria bacterium]
MTVSSDLKPPFVITPRREGFAAEIDGLNLSRNIDIITFARLHRAWMNNPVLIFPKQAITDAQQIDFAKRFGDLEIHPSLSHRSSAHPEIYRVSNVNEAGEIMAPKSTAWQYLELTWLWHTDSSFREIPSMGSILHGIEIPPKGGDTLFADMTAAYEALPNDERERARRLRVLHDHDHILSLSKGLSERQDKGSYEDLPPVSHPLVRRHPITGKRSLMLSPHTMSGIEGMAEAEGRALLDTLISHATEDRFVYRHQWQTDDVLMWDNRCTMHAVMPYDSATDRRIMHRTTITGDGPPVV